MKHLVRKSNDRGHFKNDWLEARYSFSFSHYHDPEFMGFGPLRVINQDIVQPGKGFGLHGHDNMEIVTFVRSGVLRHKDTLGSEATIVPGEVQMMSAGTGIRHSEFNDLQDKELRLMQIWLMPNKMDIKPKYEQIPLRAPSNKELVCIASEEGKRGGLNIQADGEIYWGKLDNEAVVEFKSKRQGAYWVQILDGEIKIADQILQTGDAIAVMESPEIKVFSGKEQTELLIFDLGKAV